MKIRRWSIVLWIVAVAIGFAAMSRTSQVKVRLAVLIVVPSSEEAPAIAVELSDALDAEIGGEGLGPQIVVQRKYLDVDEDRDLTKFLGLPTSAAVTCALVKVDDKNKPQYIVRRYAEVGDADETSRKVVKDAREWLDL